MNTLSRMMPSWLTRYHAATREPATNALAVVPLILLYGLGLLAASPGARSGVDVISEPLLQGLSRDGYVGVQVGVAAALIVFAIWRLKRSVVRRAALAGPMVLEAIAYGVFLGAVILFILERVDLLAISGVGPHWIDRSVIATGAGLHEELVFRLLLLPIIAIVCARGLEMPPALAIFTAIILSSLAFAGAHHLAGEAFDLYAFSYRTVAGVLFAGIFLVRGFAVAAWSHAAYDFYILGL